MVQRKCAACEQEEQVQRTCASCEAEDAVHRVPEAAVSRPDMVQRKCAACEQEEQVQRKCASCEAEDAVHRFPEPAVSRPDIVQRKCAACEQEEQVQRKCASCEAEEMVHRFPEPAVSRPDIVQRKCAACEQEEQVQRKCAFCEAEDTVHRFPEPAVARPDIVQRKNADCDAGMPVPRRSTAHHTNIIQRSCDECSIEKATPEETSEEKETENQEVEAGSDNDEAGPGGGGTVNPKAAPGGPGPVSSQFEAGLQASKGGGQPMNAPLRKSMENRFGQDFSHVRIHNNHAAGNLSASINAQAFTHGSDIYFNQNKFDDTSASGQRLLAHELTHVIQQTGPSAVKPKIQREEEDKISNWAHTWIENRMRKKDGNLITEAGVPGAVRWGKGINLAGFADLYKADDSIVSGMQAHYSKAKKNYDYIRFMDSGKRLAEMRRDGGPVKRGPVKKPDNTWDFTINFPPNFEIGEIKPLFITEFGLKSAGLVGKGIVQQSNYILGFKEFVEHVHSVFPDSIPTTKGKTMDLSKLLPNSLNYDLFDQEHTKMDADAVMKRNSNQRLWVALLGDGLAGYFLMPHPYIPKEYAEDKKKHRAKLDALILSLRTEAGKSKMPGAISRKPIQRKVIQRKDNPNAAAEAWEKKRKAWANGTEGDVPQKPKKFLKERAKGLLKRHKVDKELKKTTPPDPAKEIKDVKDVKFWSSFKGRVYGALRFRFRRAFDKIEELFKKIKTKFEKHREKSKTLKGGETMEFSWKKQAVNLIVKLAVDIFQKMIAIAFEGFSKCMDTIVEAVIGKYEKALETAAEEQLKEHEPLCCKIMEFKNKWEAEIDKYDKTIETFTLTVDKMREWTAILDKVELAVRLGVQIISCGTPPALGCLWGLVAQLGISAGMALLQKTDFWEQNIAKPAAQSLMDAIVGDKLHNLMIEALKGTPLAAYMGDKACQPRAKGAGGGGLGAIGQGLDKIDPNDPAIAKARAEWEEQYKDQIMADLKEVFESGEKGKKLTPEDIQKLVDAIKKSGKTPEDIKKMIEAGRNVKTGKVDMTKALTTVNSGTVPADQPKKERKINYAKATANNKYYASVLGWLATFFIKKPGIQPGSEEFADAVYDMQEALGIKADGIAGGATTQKFYEANGISKDKVYNKAGEVLAREKEAREQQKVLAEKKEELEALLADPKVEEALNKSFPSESQLKKDLNSYADWDQIAAGTGKFVDFNGRMAVVIVTANGAKIGAYLKSVERDENGEKVTRILTNGPFYAIDAVVEDAFAMEGKAKDGKTQIVLLYFLKDQAAGSVAHQNELFFFSLRPPKP